MIRTLVDQHAWNHVDRGVLQARLFRAMLRANLRVSERHQILLVFQKSPEIAWRALDECWLPPELVPSRDPVVATLRHFAAGATEGLSAAELEHFAQAHELPLGFLQAVITEAIRLSKDAVETPEQAIAPLHIASGLLTAELEQEMPRLYADCNSRLLLEIARRLQERDSASWLAVLADVREELERGSGDATLRRAYLDLAGRAAVS